MVRGRSLCQATNRKNIGITTRGNINIFKQQSQKPGVETRRAIAIDSENLNIRYKGVQEKVDQNIKNRIDKQPRLIRNIEFALDPNPIINGLCRPSRLSDYVAYNSARRSGPCLRFLNFLDNEQANAPQHRVFKEDTTGFHKNLQERRKYTNSKTVQQRDAPNQQEKEPDDDHSRECPRGD